MPLGSFFYNIWTSSSGPSFLTKFDTVVSGTCVGFSLNPMSLLTSAHWEMETAFASVLPFHSCNTQPVWSSVQCYSYLEWTKVWSLEL